MNTTYRTSTAVRIRAFAAAFAVTFATLAGVVSMAPSDDAPSIAVAAAATRAA